MSKKRGVTMEWYKVKSLSIATIAVDGNDLLVKFKNGLLYRYTDAACEFDKMIVAKPVERFVSSVLYRYEST